MDLTVAHYILYGWYYSWSMQTSEADVLEMKAGSSCRNSATNVTGDHAKIFSERECAINVIIVYWPPVCNVIKVYCSTLTSSM